jgi:phosphoribosylformimino-5-aminoimidazole carboxamide ribotide isomerase
MFQSPNGNLRPLKLLPVIDVRGGMVVRAVAGRRSDYRPLVSQLTSSVEPVTVARAIHERFGWREFYVADLNAISSGEPSLGLYETLRADGFRLWLDAGVRDVDDSQRLADIGIEQVVVGLETVQGPDAWHSMVQRIGAGRLVFSLDLIHGKPIADSEVWEVGDVKRIVDRVVRDGGQQLIILDLGRVGMRCGTGTDVLCADIVRCHPELAVYAGGGVRDQTDIDQLAQAGAAGVLLSSAIHDGSLPTAMVRMR